MSNQPAGAAKKQSALLEYAIVSAGALLVAAGVYFFKIPNSFSTGGVSGISIILGHFTGTVTPGWIITVINMALLVVGFAIFGRGFGARTAYASILFSLSTVAFEYLVPLNGPLTSSPMLELIYAILLTAVGSAFLFYCNASSGGTDVVAMILKKYTSINIGTALLCTDFIIAALAGLVFGVEVGLFSILGLGIKAFVVDGVIESLDQCKYFTIVTTESEKIGAYITKELNRSATKLDATGIYSGEGKTVLLTVCRRAEAVRLRAEIRRLDPRAFLMITNSSEIIGHGFRGL